MNLRPALLIRFGPKYTTGGAVVAIADLKQRHSETAASFMDRVKIAVDMLHYNVREEDRNAAYRESYERMVIVQFGGGLAEDLREKVFGVPTPPNTIGAVLTAVMAAEAEKHSKSTRLVVSEVMGEKEKNPTNEVKKDPEVSAIESLQLQMNEVLAISRQQYGRQEHQKLDFANCKCYNCNRMGHIKSLCRIPVQSVQPTRRAGQGRGRGNGRYLTRRGQFGHNFGRGGRNRSAFEISKTNDWINDWDEEGNDPAQSGNDYWGS